MTLLYRLRIERGYSLRDLADEVGVCSYATLSRIERGHTQTPHPRTRAALARVLGVPFDVLTLPDNANAAADRKADDGAQENQPSPAKDVD